MDKLTPEQRKNVCSPTKVQGRNPSLCWRRQCGLWGSGIGKIAEAFLENLIFHLKI